MRQKVGNIKTEKKMKEDRRLIILDSNGKVVKEWVSTNEPYKFEKLPVGKYTLSETIFHKLTPNLKSQGSANKKSACCKI